MIIGTRGSALALAQTQTVVRALAAATGEEPTVITVSTLGDRSSESLASLGGTGVFASALRAALLAKECDVVVHSLKDLPTAPHPGLVIAAVTKRVDARDALCARDGLTLDQLPAGARVGTGSPRRVAQLRSRRPDLEVVDIRGNVDTRLGFVEKGELDAVVLAVAGLERLGLLERATERLSLSEWPTAAGQGALAIEVREGSEKLVSKLNHPASTLLVDSERRTLALLEAGCSAPVGVHALAEDGMLFLDARVYAHDGSRFLTSSHALYLSDAKDPAGELAERVSTELFELGAAELMGASR